MLYENLVLIVSLISMIFNMIQTYISVKIYINNKNI